MSTPVCISYTHVYQYVYLYKKCMHQIWKFMIPFKLKGIQSKWLFSFWLWTKRNSIWFIIKWKNVTNIIFLHYILLSVTEPKRLTRVECVTATREPLPCQTGWMTWKWFSNWSNWKIFHPKKTYWRFNFLRFVAPFNILIGQINKLKCKMSLKIVRNWNANMFFMDGRYLNCFN